MGLIYQSITVFLLVATVTMVTSQQPDQTATSCSCPCNVMAGPVGPQGVAGPPGAAGPAGPPGIGVQGPQGKSKLFTNRNQHTHYTCQLWQTVNISLAPGLPLSNKSNLLWRGSQVKVSPHLRNTHYDKCVRLLLISSIRDLLSKN